MAVRRATAVGLPLPLPLLLRALLLLLLLVLVIAAAQVQAQEEEAKKSLCFMLYQMADNNLESAIRADLTELTESNLIQDASVTTWVYFDALNLGTEGQAFIESTSLENVFQADGSALPDRKLEGSQYFTFKHDLQRLVVDTVLEGELNSDDPQVVYDFAVYALQDCVAKGAQEFFFAFSSHGGGYAGFGGDENAQRRRLQRLWKHNNQRQLLLQNYQLVQALSQALQDVPGAPAKFDMLGFDACLMQAAGALDDFSNITKFFLASEATEPGHGWAYYALNPHDSVQHLGEEIVETFVTETQNFGIGGFVSSILNYQTGGHQTPKTLAIVNVETGFPKFAQAWEALSQGMRDILMANNDAKFHAQLNRARNSAVRFAGVNDFFGANTAQETKSEVDIGSFLDQLLALCQINPSSELFRLVQDANDAYQDMFVIARTGQGTPTATGATVHWPSKLYYQQYFLVFDQSSLNETHPWYSTSTPRWNEFLQEYLTPPTPVVSSSDSACTCGSDIVFDGLLLIDTTVDYTKGTLVTSKIPSETDLVYIKFGVDITPLIGTDQYSRQRRRRLAKSRNSSGPQIMCDNKDTHSIINLKRELAVQRFHESNDGVSNSFGTRRNHHRLLSADQQSRRVQAGGEEGDYLFGYGGSVAISYGCGDFEALWDGRFFLLEDPSGKWDWVYVDDLGNGAKSIPVLYFSTDIPEEIQTKLVNLVLTYEEALNAGAVEGSLSFSIEPCAGIINNNLALYTLVEDASLSETPRSAGGFFVPVVYVYGVVFGQERNYYLGGFNGTSFAWNEDYNMTVIPVEITDILTTWNLSTAVVEVYAVDLDYDDNATTTAESSSSSSYPSNYTGFDFVFFEAGPEDFGLVGLDVYDECILDGVDGADTTNGSPSASFSHYCSNLSTLLVVALVSAAVLSMSL